MAYDKCIRIRETRQRCNVRTTLHIACPSTSLISTNRKKRSILNGPKAIMQGTTRKRLIQRAHYLKNYEYFDITGTSIEEL
jgi:hypothetical protein